MFATISRLSGRPLLGGGILAMGTLTAVRLDSSKERRSGDTGATTGSAVATSPEYECPFCTLVKAGPCRNLYFPFEDCLDKNGENSEQACKEVFSAMINCVADHPDEYRVLMNELELERENEPSDETGLLEEKNELQMETKSVNEATDKSKGTTNGTRDETGTQSHSVPRQIEPTISRAQEETKR